MHTFTVYCLFNTKLKLKKLEYFKAGSICKNNIKNDLPKCVMLF